MLDAASARIDSPVAFSTVASGPCACHQRVLRNTAPAPCYRDYCLACRLRLEARNPGWSSTCHAVVAFSFPQANFDRKWSPDPVRRMCGRGVTQMVTSREVHYFELPRDQICRLFRLTNTGPPLPLPWCISVLSCIPSQAFGIRGRAEPGSLSLYSGPIIAEGDTNHATLWSHWACRCTSPSYLNGILTLARDSRPFRLMAESLKSWNAAEAVSVASILNKGAQLTCKILWNKETVWGSRGAECGQERIVGAALLSEKR